MSISTSGPRPTVLIMDSLALLIDLNDHTILQIATILKTEKSAINLEKLSVQQQIDKTDCGLFTITFAVEACTGTDVETCYI